MVSNRSWPNAESRQRYLLHITDDGNSNNNRSFIKNNLNHQSLLLHLLPRCSLGVLYIHHHFSSGRPPPQSPLNIHEPICEYIGGKYTRLFITRSKYVQYFYVLAESLRAVAFRERERERRVCRTCYGFVGHHHHTGLSSTSSSYSTPLNRVT